jgi:Zn-dependent peptidase ImmA (M78 family)
MADDYRVKSRRNAEVKELAKKVRPRERYVDVLEFLKRPTIWTVLGEKRLKFSARPDAEMGSSAGLTRFVGGTVHIDIKKSVVEKAFFGDGRARNTCAHEPGHAVLGHDRGIPMARRELRNVTPDWIQPFESAEHQAKVFAVAFLIDDAVAQTLPSAEDISAEFGISLESAAIYFDEMIKEREREQKAQEMLRKAEEFRASVAPKTQKICFLQELCASCKQQRLFPVGAKYMCQNCNAVFDRFQDGDSAS